jgi:hypothetical protein
MTVNETCPKCGFNHDNPNSEIGAVQVLACVLTESRYHFKVSTRYGPVRPMTIIPLDKKREK